MKIFGNSAAHYISILFKDHGILRLFYRNFAHIFGGVYRANQPLPFDIAYYRRKYGIKTILNLRGDSNSPFIILEKAACAEHNVNLISFPLRSYVAPSRAHLLALLDQLERLEPPALIHCKSGADRTGAAAVLYLLQNNVDFQSAKKHLHWRYMHFKSTSAGILDFLFETWQRDCKKKPVGFRQWVNESYDQGSLMSAFTAGKKPLPTRE